MISTKHFNRDKQYSLLFILLLWPLTIFFGSSFIHLSSLDSGESSDIFKFLYSAVLAVSALLTGLTQNWSAIFFVLLLLENRLYAQKRSFQARQTLHATFFRLKASAMLTTKLHRSVKETLDPRFAQKTITLGVLARNAYQFLVSLHYASWYFGSCMPDAII